MKLIIPWYKLIAQAFKDQDLENVLSKGSSCTILKMRLLFFFFFNLEIFFGKDLETLKFFSKNNIYMNKVDQMLHGFLKFKET